MKKQKRNPQMPARVKKEILVEVNKIRRKHGYTWEGLMNRLFAIYIKYGTELFDEKGIK